MELVTLFLMGFCRIKAFLIPQRLNTGIRVDMQQSQCFGETLNGQFFQIMGSDTNISMGRFVDVVRGVSVTQSIGYVSYLI